RALVIGQHEYWDHYLSGTDVDARNMYNKFLNNPPYGKMEKLQGWLDVSGRGILSEISKTFAGADNNSVSIFYYSGHGSSDGYIFGTDNPYAGSGAVSSTELANALKQIPGKIVVILDCCHSGYHINKSMSEEDIAAFNANIINAFKAVDVVSKTPGQMANSKFHVLTASSKTEVSWGSSTGGVFTKALVNAKDRNSDGFVSIGEGYWAAKAYDNVPIYSEGQYYYQHVQCYPSANDPLLLWKK
ncbi:MAG: caspase family protein, partial [Christensenellaceae bacterium]|nr:caspase family protein [Christensenellaceae bacterium]